MKPEDILLEELDAANAEIFRLSRLVDALRAEREGARNSLAKAAIALDELTEAIDAAIWGEEK